MRDVRAGSLPGTVRASAIDALFGRSAPAASAELPLTATVLLFLLAVVSAMLPRRSRDAEV